MTAGELSTDDTVPARFPRARAMIVLGVLILALNAITVHEVTQLSKIDEHYWVDYLVRGSHFRIEQYGDRIEQETVRELCTRGLQDGTGPPCHKGHLNPSDWYPEGVNLTGHSPFYFLITGPVARVLRASPLDLGPNDSLVTWGRLLSGAWLLLGCYLTLRAGELLGVNRRLLVVALVLIAATPALLHAATTVNPDVTAFPAGAAVLLAALSWERTGKRMWLVALTALVAAAFDPTNGIGVLIVLGFVALRALSARTAAANGERDDAPRPWQDYAKLAAILVVAVMVANRGWDALYSFLQGHVLPMPANAHPRHDPINDAYRVGSLTASQLLGSQTVFALVPPFNDIALPHARSDAFYVTLARAAELLTVAALGLALLRERISSRLGALGLATLGALLVSPSLLVAYNYVVGSTYDLIVPRYGISALPALAIVVVAAVRTTLSRAVLTFVAAGVYVSAIVVVLVN